MSELALKEAYETFWARVNERVEYLQGPVKCSIGEALGSALAAYQKKCQAPSGEGWMDRPDRPGQWVYRFPGGSLGLIEVSRCGFLSLRFRGLDSKLPSRDGFVSSLRGGIRWLRVPDCD